jgi:hypothetical protein
MGQGVADELCDVGLIIDDEDATAWHGSLRVPSVTDGGSR